MDLHGLGLDQYALIDSNLHMKYKGTDYVYNATVFDTLLVQSRNKYQKECGCHLIQEMGFEVACQRLDGWKCFCNNLLVLAARERISIEQAQRLKDIFTMDLPSTPEKARRGMKRQFCHLDTFSLKLNYIEKRKAKPSSELDSCSFLINHFDDELEDMETVRCKDLRFPVHKLVYEASPPSPTLDRTTVDTPEHLEHFMGMPEAELCFPPSPPLDSTTVDTPEQPVHCMCLPEAKSYYKECDLDNMLLKLWRSVPALRDHEGYCADQTFTSAPKSPKMDATVANQPRRLPTPESSPCHSQFSSDDDAKTLARPFQGGVRKKTSRKKRVAASRKAVGAAAPAPVDIAVTPAMMNVAPAPAMVCGASMSQASFTAAPAMHNAGASSQASFTAAPAMHSAGASTSKNVAAVGKKRVPVSAKRCRKAAAPSSRKRTKPMISTSPEEDEKKRQKAVKEKERRKRSRQTVDEVRNQLVMKYCPKKDLPTGRQDVPHHFVVKYMLKILPAIEAYASRKRVMEENQENLKQRICKKHKNRVQRLQHRGIC